MASKFLSLEGLKEHINQQNSVGAREFLENVVLFFHKDLTEAELVLALDVLFHKNNGTIKFLHKTIKAKKLFQESNVLIFNLWVHIIKEHGSRTHMKSYVDEIVTCCLEYISSTQVSAKEKERSIIVIQELFNNEVMTDIDGSGIVTKVLDVINVQNRPVTFTQQIYRLLGIICKVSPESIAEKNANIILNIFLKCLENIVLNEQSIKCRELLGAMEGLDMFLINFAPSPLDESVVFQQIYVCIKKLSFPPSCINQKALFRATLSTFTSHASLFVEYIFKDFVFWQDCLVKWLNSTNFDDQRIGTNAMLVFHTIIADHLQTENDVDKSTLIFLFNYFRNILESQNARKDEMRIAIRGFGALSRSCKRYFPEHLNNMLLLVLQRTDLISVSEDDQIRDGFEQLPDYIRALSQIILTVDDQGLLQLLGRNIERIVVRFIKDFYHLSRAHISQAVNSLCSAFHNLSNTNGLLLDNILEKVVFQGVIWTCSHKLIYEAEIDTDTDIDWKDKITYKHYLPFWEGLINENVDLKFDKLFISEKIFNFLLTSLFGILKKLNLQTKRRVITDENGKNQEFYFCDPNIDLCPVRPKDFHIFFNLVDFYSDILHCNYKKENFRQWMNEYCTKMIRYSLKFPLVSGFLKLIQIGVNIGDELNYFKKINSLSTNDTLSKELSNLLKTTIAKTQKVSGELQISCLELILSFPIRFYGEYFIDLIPIFKIAFDLGKSFIWLAELGITALHKICDNYETNDRIHLIRFYKNVLPNLNLFLKCNTGTLTEYNVETVIIKNQKNIANRKSIKNTDILSVKKHIISFLGKLEPEHAALVISNSKQEDLTKWNDDRNIGFVLQMQDLRLELYLDEIIPRICYLAISSTDRNTKIASCEFVHALILYLIGMRKNEGRIWKELCMRILILGSDGDETVQNLFRPLLRQLMHFMSKYENLERGCETLMEVLMNGVSSNSNSSLRDLSAECLREFVIWGIKQTTPEQLEASPVGMHLILTELKLYSVDCCSAKRNGAAIAFNNLYVKLREEETLCDIFFLDLLHTFCINFKLTEEFSLVPLGDLNVDIEAVSLSLDHIVRVIKERSYLYNKKNIKRIIPPTFENHGLLQNVVEFLINETHSKAMHYRLKCIEMIKLLAPEVLNISSVSAFLNKYTTIDKLKVICEGTLDDFGIKSQPVLETLIGGNTIPHVVYNWLEHLLSSLDCYVWLLSNYGLQDPKPLFEEAKIFLSIIWYLKNVASHTFTEIVENLGEKYNESCTTVFYSEKLEQDRIESIKCIIIVRILGFLTAVIKAGCASKIPNNFWLDNVDLFSNLIIQFIFEPEVLKFDFRLEEISTNLPDVIQKFFEQLQKKCLDEAFKESLNKNLTMKCLNYLQEISNCSRENLIANDVPNNQRSLVRGILFVLKKLKIIESQPQLKATYKLTTKLLMRNLFEGVTQKVLGKTSIIILPPVVKKYGNSLLEVCFIYGDGIANDIVNYILDESMCFSDTASEIKHGEHFYNIYKTCLFKECNSRFIKDLLDQLFAKFNSQNSSFILKVCSEIFNFLVKYSKENMLAETFFEVCLKNISKIIETWNEFSNDQLFIEIILQLTDVFPKNKSKLRGIIPNLQMWVINHLKSDTLTLERKSKVLSLLPLLIDVADKSNEDISDALLTLQRKHLPLQSRELTINSLKETTLKLAFKSILDALVTSRSFIILDFLIKCTASDPKHIVEWMIHEKQKVYIESLNDIEQFDMLTNVFDIVLNENVDSTIRYRIAKRFLLPLFQNASENAALMFFVKYIIQINRLIDSNYGIGKSGWAVEQAMTNRIIGFSLIETFMGIVPKEKFSFKNSDLSIALLKTPKSDGEFIATLTKKAFYARSDIFVTDEPSTVELFRLYQCSAYRAICAIVCNTQNKLEYYTKFLFQENPTKNEYIWEKLVDCNDNKEYVFPSQEVEVYPRVKERFVAIRKINPAAGLSHQLLTASNDFQTQNIFESSLSQDVNKIDMNYSTVRTDIEALAHKEKRSQAVVSVNLERHLLNKHEVMATICGVIQHMHDNEISPIITDLSIKKSYAWVDEIAKTMGSFQTQKNVRIFLAQVVDNCQNIFKQYAHVMFRPILEILVDECGGKQLNFFITDMIALLLCWSMNNVYKPNTTDEKRLASDLLAFLMKNAWNEKKQIFKFNLELIKTIIITWKDVLSISSHLILELMTQSQNLDVKDNAIGLTLAGTVLSNDLIPWGNNKDIFLDAILMNLNNSHSSVNQISANVAGMCLNKLNSSNDMVTYEKFHNHLIIMLKMLKGKRDNKSEKKFLDLLFGIHKFHSEILDSFGELIAFKIPVAVGAIKRMYMEMLLTRMESFEEEHVYNIIISIGIKDLLKHADYQLLALHIANRSIRSLQENQYEVIHEIIGSCSESHLAESRDLMYEIFIYVFKNYKTQTLKYHAAKFLLNGLEDRDPQIRKRIFDFWSTEAGLPDKTSDLMSFLLKDFGINCNKHFLGFCIELLLEKAIQHPDSKEKIFAYETNSDAKLLEYEINTQLRFKTSLLLPPLFAETQFNQNISQSCLSRSSSLVRGTNEGLFFEPTQQRELFGITRNNFSLPTQSSLGISFSSQVLDRQSKKVTPDQSLNQKNVNALRPRFLKDNKKESHRYLVVDVTKRKTVRKINHTKLKESNVILYRRYRHGDYPDMLINRLAYLLPLQAIIKGDEVVARQLFVSIFESIVKALGNNSTTFMNFLGPTIENILTSSKTCEPSVFSALIEICLIKPEKFNIEPSIVATLAKATKKFSIGAIYLEERINADWELDNLLLSKTSTTKGSLECEHWLHLSDIYTSLKEYDIVSSIFENKIDTDPRLSEAVELKSNGLYQEAIKLLVSVIQRNVKIEQYYAYNCYYDCIMELGNWSGLSDLVQQQIDDVEELWSDEYNTNFILPKLMQAEIQLILDNNSTRNKNFLTIVENWMRDPIKRDYIKSNFCEELMMLHIANQNFLQARVYCETFLNRFFINWEIVSSLCDKLKLENLLEVQKVSEIDHYASMLLDDLKENTIEILHSRWEKCVINKTDSLLYWNSIVSYRSYIAAIVSHKLNNINSQSTCGVLQAIHNMELQLFSAAIFQNNHGLAKFYLERLPGINAEQNEKNTFDFRLAQVKFTLLEGKRQSNIDNSIEWMQQAWSSVKSLINCENLKLYPHNYSEALKANAEIGEHIANLIKEYRIGSHISNNLITLATHSNSQDLQQRIFDDSLWSFQQLSNLADTLLVDLDISLKDIEIIADCYYKLGQFCYDYNDNQSLEKGGNFQDILIISILKAMQYNSKDARQLFACILQLPKVNEKPLSKVFVEQSTNIPEWMFLAWIPQLLSRFNYENPCYLDGILERVSDAYPNAIKYPFDLWYERNHNSTSISNDREVIRNIKNSLKNPLTEKFVESFKYLCIPEILLISLLEILLKFLRNENNLTQEEFDKKLEKLCATVYSENESCALQGIDYRRIYDYKSSVMALKSKSVQSDLQDIIIGVSKLIRTLRSGLNKLSTEIRLEKICPWLANFQWCGEERSLELPGQYMGKAINSKPFVQNHIKVVKFNKKIQMFHSQRYPFRLLIHGSDGNIYEFLVKFGDDLKQDQRIQQILCLMSDKLSEDRNSQNHNLFVRTYNVVPIYEYCGILNFVSSSISMREMIEKCLKRREPNAEVILNSTYLKYINFIKESSKNCMNPDNTAYYGNAVCTYSRENLLQNFRSIENNIDLDIIKYALIDLALSSESFFTLKKNFATSLATMNISNWILGIADRHLQNLLINVTDGTLTGIDFGMTFGSGTRDLSVPELTPFRLTPHFVHALNPMGTNGFVFKCMSHALRVFKQSEKVFLAYMEVFIKEPSVNWLSTIQLNRDDMGSRESLWEPFDRIDIAKCKLRGFNPMHLFERELKVGVISKNPNYLEGYLRILRGHKQFNVRSRLPIDGLSVENQVKCLIDQATDPAILGISYAGLTSWI